MCALSQVIEKRFQAVDLLGTEPSPRGLQGCHSQHKKKSPQVESLTCSCYLTPCRTQELSIDFLKHCVCREIFIYLFIIIFAVQYRNKIWRIFFIFSITLNFLHFTVCTNVQSLSKFHGLLKRETYSSLILGREHFLITVIFHTIAQVLFLFIFMLVLSLFYKDVGLLQLAVFARWSVSWWLRLVGSVS